MGTWLPMPGLVRSSRYPIAILAIFPGAEFNLVVHVRLMLAPDIFFVFFWSIRGCAVEDCFLGGKNERKDHWVYSWYNVLILDDEWIEKVGFVPYVGQVNVYRKILKVNQDSVLMIIYIHS